MARALVVDCNAQGRGGRRSTLDVIGVGPRLAATILERLGLETELVHCSDLDAVRSMSGDARVLGVSAMVGDEPSARRVLGVWRRYRKGGGIAILGGALGLDPGRALGLGFDAVIVGEAELPLIRLAEEGVLESTDPLGALEALAEQGRRIPGVAFRSARGVVYWGRAPFTPRELLNKYRSEPRFVEAYPWFWGSRVYIEVVRGCSNFYRPTIPLPDGRRCVLCNLCREGLLEKRLWCPLGIPPGCGYCSVPAFHGWARSVDRSRIVDEVRGLVRLGVTRIVLSAPDFLDYGRDYLVAPHPLTDPRSPPPNTREIEALLRELHSIPEVRRGEAVVMVENVKPSLVTEEVAEVMGRYLRGTPIYIGLETGDPEFHRALGRPSTVEECLRAVKLFAEHGLRPYVYLLHGLPGEKDEHLERTAELIPLLKKLGVERIVLYRFRPLPMTAFEKAPLSPPAVSRPAAKRLYEEVRRFNEEQKRVFIGRVFRSALVSVYRRRFLVAYPLAHGPTTLIRGPRSLIGCLADVEVTGVISDRLVEGRVLKVVKCIDRRLVPGAEHKYGY